MVKVKFTAMSVLPNMSTMSNMIAREFDLDATQVLQTMTSREALGSTAIAEHVTMPHVELADISEQGLFLINSENESALVLIIDSHKQNDDIITLLSNLLVMDHLKRLRKIKSQQAFEEFIKEVMMHAIR